jgi:RHS repeat-associated protein
MGSTTVMTDCLEALACTAQFDSFGNIIASTGTLLSCEDFAGNAGYERDLDSQLVLAGHRYYDPATGRFLSRDPGKVGRNWYAYCSNRPNNRVDASGLGDYPPYLDGLPNTFEDWFSGQDEVGPGGERVRIGGWPALINPSGNAITVNGTVHLNDKDDWELYKADTIWQGHERRHIVQEETYFHGSACAFVAASTLCYALGHDGSPLEIDADNHGGKPHRSPFETLSNLWNSYKKMLDLCDPTPPITCTP